MPQLSQGSDVTLTLDSNDIVSIVASNGEYKVEQPSGTVLAVASDTRAYGPFPAGGTFKITATQRGLYYEQASLNQDSTYLGQVATRGSYPEAKFGTNQISCRIQHFARAAMRGAVFKYVNYYGTAATGTGSTATIQAKIEYPIGTFTDLTFGGSVNGVMADGTDITSDPLPINIPDGALFQEWTKFANTTGAPYSLSSDNVDKSLTAASTPAAGVLTGLFGGNFVYGALAILGQTDKPSILIIGDSRQAGAGAALAYGTNDVSNLARPIAGSFGYINIACSGAPTQQFVYTSPAKIKALADYCSHIIVGGGINDINGGNTAAQCKTNFEALIAAYNPTGRKPVFVCTVEPYTTSTDTWATAANQTIWDATKEVQRKLHNANVAGNQIVGQWGFFDLALGVEDPANPGKWKSPGYTTDGLHGLVLAAMAQSIYVPASQFGIKAYT